MYGFSPEMETEPMIMESNNPVANAFVLCNRDFFQRKYSVSPEAMLKTALAVGMLQVSVTEKGR